MFSIILTNLPSSIFGIITGIISQQSFFLFIETPLFILICFLVILFFLATSNKHARLCALLLVSYCTGTYISSIYEKKYECYEQLFSNHRLTVIAKVVDKNKINNNTQNSYTQLTIQVVSFRTVLNPIHQPINARVVLTTNNTPPDVGDTITIKNFLCTSPSESLRTWLRKNNLSGYAYHVSDITVTHHPTISIHAILWHVRNRIQEAIQSKLSPHAYGLFSMLFLGVSDPQTASTHHKIFSYWGLNHYLARAGLHLLIFVLILNLLMGIITTRFITKAFIHIGTAGFYYLLTWQNMPFVRSFLVLVASQCCHMLRTPINTLHLLNLVMVGYTIFHPHIIFSLDFQLTFLITYTLILISRYTPFKSY